LHDGITLERLGFPTATIITHVFETTAQAYTRLMGVPGFPYLICPHPITNVGADGLDERIKLLAPRVARLLQDGVADG
jgi:hypothetical protein